MFGRTYLYKMEDAVVRGIKFISDMKGFFGCDNVITMINILWKIREDRK